MKPIVYRWFSFLAMIGMLASLLPGPAVVQAQSGDIFLPLVGTSPGAPQFTIVSPSAGLSVSGTSLFAVQPSVPGTIAQVAFRAGSVDLGTDDTPADGFRVFLDAGQLPTGPITLAATATSLSGETATETVNVTIVPQAPARASVGTGGATLATTSGNTIIVPPNAVDQTTTIAVADKSQEQVTTDAGIDWDGLGVTFLGAIDVQTTGEFARPFGVSSVGFGNRVQPGQAVVTYRILPDADGDGIGELVVVNGAELAPNGTIVSSAVSGIVVHQLQISSPAAALQAAATGQPQGAPGALLTIEASGLNPLSSIGNLAIFESKVDGSTLTVPGIVEQGFSGQIFTVVVPSLPAGDATLTLKNQSTGESAGPFTITILAAPALGQSAATIVESYFSQSKSFLEGLSGLSPQEESERTKTLARLNEMKTQFDLIAADPAPDAQQMVRQFATLIEGSGVLAELAAAEVSASALQCLTSSQKNLLNLIAALGVISGSLGCALGFTGAGAAYCAAAFAAAGAIDAYLVAEAPECPKDPPPACVPAPAASGPGTTGMGAAPPPGGNGCGNVSGGPSSFAQSASINQFDNGRYIVRIFPQASGGRSLSPFTGATDPGGYFFIPLIPVDEPFRAVATDLLTGASVAQEGVGPALNQSVYMNFDFSEAAGNLYTIAIGDTITDGVPGPGAGNIEVPGGVDIYTFSGTAGQQVYFQLTGVDPALALVRWKLQDPSGETIFDRVFNCCGGSNPGVYTLPTTGIYTIRAGESSDPGTGTYGFKLWNVPAPHQFPIAIGDTVSNGVPGAGAGNIESPGVKDIYTFNASAGQQVYFELFDVVPELTHVNWKLTTPDGSVIFDRILNCCGGSNIGVRTLEQSGTYTITVGDDSDPGTGTYSFKLWNVPAPDQFAIAIGDTVSNGVPGAGAGNIETRGVKDIYTFNASAGQEIYFELFDVVAELTHVNWKLTAPDGTVIFDRILNCCGGSDIGVRLLEQSGTYTITVGDDSDPGTGTYGFKLWNVPAPHQFTLAIGDYVTNGVPGPGAGNIESRGVKDVYTFNATAGQQVYFELFDVVAELTHINWKLTAPDGTVIFDRILNCCGGSDVGVRTLEQSGTYTITVGDDSDPGIGTYGFKLWNVPAPHQFAIAIGDTVSNGVPGPGAGNIESRGVRDIYTFNASAGQRVYFALFDVVAELTHINWKLTAPDGTVIFDRIFNCCGGSDVGELTLAQAGTYTITVGDDSDPGTGTYSFELRNP